MQKPVQEVISLLFSDQPAVIADWAIQQLGLEESWRASNDEGVVEHIELRWAQSRISINATRDGQEITGKTSLGLRLDDDASVRALYQRASEFGAEIRMALTESKVALSFTLADPDGNEWWVNAETGFLNQLRKAK